MRDRNILLLLLIFFPLFSSAVFAEGDLPLRIEASTDQNSVKSGMMFLAHVSAANPSADTTTDFWANSCSYEKHWMTDNAGVFIQSWTCNENTLENVTLEPGDSYEKNIILYIPQPDNPGPVSFRLGFKRMSENGDIAEPLWSNTVTMTIIASEAPPEGEPSATGPAEDPVPQDDIAPVESPGPAQDRNDAPGNDVDPAVAKKIP